MPTYTREISSTFDCGSTPRLDIRTVNGPLRLWGEERGDVHVLMTVRYRAEHDHEADALVQAIDEGIHAEGDRLVIRSPDTEGGSFFDSLRNIFGSHRNLEIDLAIAAPRACSLALHHVNGQVDLHQISGEVRVNMVNGRFDATELSGDLSVHQVNGRCVVSNAAGRVGIHHTNGAIEVENAGGDVELRLVNGSVDILNPAGSVKIKGVGGAYSFTGAVRSDVTIDNAHGRITLDLPRDSRFHLDAHSATGNVTSELEVKDSDEDATAGLLPRVRLRSETGRIELRAHRHTAAAGV